MELRQLLMEEYDDAKALVMEVFMQFEAPDYGAQGVETFKRTGIEDDAYMASLTMYGAFEGKHLVGIIATRNEGKHIALFFVKGSYHQRGIGTALFELVKKDAMTVNSSPYAEKVYERLGFIRTAGEQCVDGICFIPMKYLPEVHNLLTCLNGKNIQAGYHAFLELESLADESNILHAYTQMFADMVESDSYEIRVRGFVLFCKQARWDTDFVVDGNVEKVLVILHDPKPTAVRMALAVLPTVLEHKPALRNIVENAVRGIPYTQYKETMQGLIEKDAQKLLCRKGDFL